MEIDAAIADPPLAAALVDAIEATLEGVTIADMRRPDAPLVYVNAGFERMTGYSRSDALGRNCRFLQGPGTDPAAVARLRAAIAAGAPCVEDLRNYRKDGTPFWNRLSLTPLRGPGGALTHYAGIQYDVTAEIEQSIEIRQALELLEQTNRQLTKANRRMKADLDTAARIQQALLPETLPEARGYGFAWKYLPCDELAGDTLNLFPLGKGRIGAYLLDVSGHGTAAALLAVAVSRMLSPLPSASSLVWQHCPTGLCIAPPAQVAAQLNELYRWDPDAAQFITLVYGILDTRRHEFRFITAGHPGPLCLSAKGDVTQAATQGLPIGLSEAPFGEQVLRLAPGDRLVLYSDGICEPRNAAGALFGCEGLARALKSGRGAPLDQALDQMLAAAAAWRGSQRFQDDVSLLAFDRLRQAPAA